MHTSCCFFSPEARESVSYGSLLFSLYIHVSTLQWYPGGRFWAPLWVAAAAVLSARQVTLLQHERHL